MSPISINLFFNIIKTPSKKEYEKCNGGNLSVIEACCVYIVATLFFIATSIKQRVGTVWSFAKIMHFSIGFLFKNFLATT